MNTEPAYFRMINNVRKDAHVRVEAIIAAGVPLTISKTASRRAFELKKSKDSFENLDEVWAVFDRDTHPNWVDAIDLCRRSGVRIAYSNPCFELWLVLHYQEHDAPCNSKQIQSLANDIIPGYDGGGTKTPDCKRLEEFVEDAEMRAERQCGRRFAEGMEGGCPSTTVWELTRAIRDWRAQP